MYDLVIIGAGPAGISMAAEARRSGISEDKIIILEKSEEHSYSIRKFYPDQKLVTANYKGQAALCKGVMCLTDTSKQETLSLLDQAIESYKINVHYKETVYKIQKQTDGTFVIGSDKGEYASKTCVIAIGMMGKPNKPDWSIPPELRSDVVFDITSQKIENCEVLVIGGGDSASEYAQYLNQEGNKVTFSYRKTEFSRMNEINRDSLLELSKRGDVPLLLGSNVTGVEPGTTKAVKVNFQEEEFGSLEYDKVVLALGGSTPKNFLALLNIDFNGDDPIVKDGFETSIPGLFLIGDLSAGRKGGSIISAFNSSHDAMKKICDSYLSCEL
jgi:thioredoxin reductase (NADPH)